MLKKFITGLLALTLMTGMAGTITSFADDTTGEDITSTTIEKTREGKEGRFRADRLSIFGEKGDRPERSEDGERAARSENGERLKKGDRAKGDRKNMTEEEREALKAERGAKREETLNNMYPEIVETHAALRTDLETSKEEVKSIKDQINAITGVDKEAQKTANEDIFNMSEENKAKLEDIRTQFQALKENRGTTSKELKEAVANEDSAAFKTAFDKIIDTLETTLSLENQKIEVLTDVLSNLQ